MIKTKNNEYIFPSLSAAIVNEGSQLHPSTQSMYPIRHTIIRKENMLYYKFCTHKNDEIAVDSHKNTFRCILEELSVPFDEIKCVLTHSAAVDEWAICTPLPSKTEVLWKLKM